MLVQSEKGECEVAWCTANETFLFDNKSTSPYTVHREKEGSVICAGNNL